MFTKSSQIYDLLYSFKDYQKESEEIINLIKSKKPYARTILDVGCGTAEHHKYFDDAFAIDGLDISEEFVDLAIEKNPGGTYHVADMTEFALDKKYDILICLFSSIGYVKTFEKLKATLRCFYEHLNHDGLVIVEPWLTPDNWYNGKLHMLTYDKDDIKICRMNMSASEGNMSILHFHYLVGNKEKAVVHFEERHELALFTEEEMKKAFDEADFEVIFDKVGITGRGLYYGVRRSDVT